MGLTSGDRRAGRTWPTLLGAVAAVAALAAGRADAQPANAAPNPYRTVEGWAKMPEGRTWGATSAVDVARDGRSIWVAERCGANTCAGSTLPAVLLFDESGRLQKSFAAGVFVFPHGIHVDRGGNVWVTDARGRDGKGHQVFKFSAGGKRGIRVGSAKDGKVTAFIPDPEPDPEKVVTSASEGVAADAQGNVYGAEVGPRALKRYEKK